MGLCVGYIVVNVATHSDSYSYYGYYEQSRIASLLYFLLFIFMSYATLQFRYDLQQRRQIQDDQCGIFYAICCMYCTLCQLAAEAEVDEKCCNMNEPDPLFGDGAESLAQPMINPDASGYNKV